MFIPEIDAETLFHLTGVIVGSISAAVLAFTFTIIPEPLLTYTILPLYVTTAPYNSPVPIIPCIQS